MGSVIDQMECPNCKSENCQIDYYYKSNEYYVICQECGYYNRRTLKRTEKGGVLLHDWRAGHTWDNLVYEEVKFENPYGFSRISKKNGFGQGRTIVDEEDFRSFMCLIDGIEKDEIEEISISRYTDGEIRKEILYRSEVVRN